MVINLRLTVITGDCRVKSASQKLIEGTEETNWKLDGASGRNMMGCEFYQGYYTENCSKLLFYRVFRTVKTVLLRNSKISNYNANVSQMVLTYMDISPFAMLIN